MAGKRLTIEDIARLAGVSKATVSRVLNGKPDVDPITRARIQRLMDEQGFVPSATATNLAGGRSHLIGMLVRSYTWLFIPEIMRAVADLIDQTTYELVLYRMNDQLPEEEGNPAISRLLASNLTAALLAVFPGQASVQLAALSKNAVPVVVIDDQYDPIDLSWGEQLPIPWITSDNQKGAYEAVRHLIGHGHQRIAHIQGPMKWLCSRERHEGYCQALAEAGLEVNPALIREGDFTGPTGQVAAEQLFSLPPKQRPTAIFASSDLMAYGVLAAAQKHGLSIPDDVALVGFDDLADMAESIVVIAPGQLPLTTVRQPFYEMGQRALKLLLSLLEMSYANGYRPADWSFSLEPGISTREASRLSGTILRLRLPVKLIVRDSCGCGHSAVLADEEPPL
ncbi:MAG TPA: LacI family DNA-binding transcriptional regulator [Ktedonobacterales bacterium]|nr:LacI family DNA-binding transcriptional regulator [Ktedonobacterales bacterium]